MRQIMKRFVRSNMVNKRGSSGSLYSHQRALHLDALESRRMLAVTATFTSGALEVDGDSSANDISVTFEDVSGTDYLIVKDRMTTVYDGTPTGQNVKTSDVTSIDVAGADGNDTLDLSDVSSANGFAGLDGEVAVGGDGGSDSIIGSSFADNLSASSGADTIEGGDGDDTLLSGTGDDSLSGGLGSDQYVFLRGAATQSLGSDTLTEGTGGSNDATDLLIFSNFLEAIDVDLSSTSAQAVNTDADLTITLNANDAFEGVLGTTLADVLTGNDRDSTFSGGSGNDTITAGAGNDTLLGDAGNDSIVAGGGDDIIFGGRYCKNLWMRMFENQATFLVSFSPSMNLIP